MSKKITSAKVLFSAEWISARSIKIWESGTAFHETKVLKINRLENWRIFLCSSLKHHGRLFQTKKIGLVWLVKLDVTTYNTHTCTHSVTFCLLGICRCQCHYIKYMKTLCKFRQLTRCACCCLPRKHVLPDPRLCQYRTGWQQGTCACAMGWKWLCPGCGWFVQMPDLLSTIFIFSSY